MAALPARAHPYRRTAEFTETTLPLRLRRAHTTKAGARAAPHVIAGRLAYGITDPQRPRSETVLTPETPPQVTEPATLHEVEPLGPVRFYAEFHSPPGP